MTYLHLDPQHQHEHPAWLHLYPSKPSTGGQKGTSLLLPSTYICTHTCEHTTHTYTYNTHTKNKPKSFLALKVMQILKQCINAQNKFNCLISVIGQNCHTDRKYSCD